MSKYIMINGGIGGGNPRVNPLKYYLRYKYNKMRNYNCSTCNYSTDHKTDMTRHNNTKRHSEKSNNPVNKNVSYPIVTHELPQVTLIKGNDSAKKIICNKCQIIFAHKSGLSRHRKICIKNDDIKEKLSLKAQLEIERLKTKLAEQEKKHMQEKIDILSGYKNIAENTAETSKTSCSALNYAMKHFNKAPRIQEFSEFKMLTYGNEQYSIAEIIIHKQKKGELYSFIGDILVRQYKTTNPEDQAVWNTDSSRLAYLIRELGNDNEEWFTDKGGIKISKYITKPVLDYIKVDLNRYIKEKKKSLLDEDLEDAADVRHNLITANQILININKNDLNKEIIKYIAEFLHLDRKTDIKKLTFENNNAKVDNDE